MIDNKKLLRIKEAAEMLGVNPETLRRWDNEGSLKAVRIGKRGDRRYVFEDLQKFISKSKKAPSVGHKLTAA